MDNKSADRASQTPDSLAAALREAREAEGLSIRALAELVGTDHSLLSRIEASKVARPSADLLRRLAEALHLDAAVLQAYIGIRPSYPEPRVYFRAAFGVSDDEARDMLNLLQEQYGSKINRDTKHTENDEI